MHYFAGLQNFFTRNIIFGWILLVSLVPFFIITYLAIKVTNNALYEEITQNLSFIADQKASEIERYLIASKKNATLLAKDPTITQITKALITHQPLGNTTILNNYLKNLLERYQLTDIFISSPSGQIIFSLQHPKLIRQEFGQDALKNTELGKTIDNAKTLLESTLSDFVRVDNFTAPQLYIASPIIDPQQKLLGVLVLQMSNQEIEKVIKDANGLGNTGETLVGIFDNQIIPTSGLRHSTIEQFLHTGKKAQSGLENAFQDASLGTIGVGEMSDYRNQKVLAAWRYLPSMRWGMLVKIDQIEAFDSITQFKKEISFLTGITLLLALFLAFTVARKFQTAENELKRLLAEVEHAKNDAFDANLAKSAFLANMSHELRTPLNAIIGYSEMLIEDAEDQSLNSFIEDLNKINGAGQHLLGLINDILDISKIEAGRMDLYIEKIDIAPMLEEIRSLVAPLVQKKNNSFALNYLPDIGIMDVDITKLRQCLLNLISNASKFTENGSITLRVEAEKHQGNDCIRFTVKDTGIGMTPEQLTKIFQAFTQADISTTRKFGGTGLGLYLTQKFTTMLNGEILVESEVDEGSEFSLILPRHSVKTFVEETKEVEAAALPLILPTVLIIDDDKSFHSLMEENLGGKFKLLHAYNGEEGLKLAKEHHPSAITLDVIMPGMDGWSVLKNLRMDPSLATIPTIMASVTGDKDLGYTLGIADFLIKPVNPATLLQQLQKYISEKKSNVLVVEDDTATRKLMVKMLYKAGIAVREAENGKQALDRIAEEIPSLILLDLMMPIMDGFELVNRLRNHKEWINIPIIIITAKDLTENERAYLNNAFTTVMRKGGYRKKELISAIHEQINQSLKLEASAPATSAIEQKPLAKESNVKSILIIDDNPSINEDLKQFFAEAQFKLIHAKDGDHGLELAITQEPQVIVLDIMMRTQDGLDLLTKLRSNPDTMNIPMIVLSALSSEKFAFMRGVREFLVKPVDPKSLIEKINEHVGFLPEISVLIVDDDPDIRHLYKKMLKSTGWELREAENGKEALRKISESIPTLMLLDLNMPEMDGFAVVEQLAENPAWQSVEVIIITAKDLSREEMKKLTDSAAKVFQKSNYNKQELLQEIHLAISTQEGGLQ